MQKKLGAEWKKKMLIARANKDNIWQFSAMPAAPRLTFNELHFEVVPNLHSKLVVVQPSKYEKLVDELIAAKKSDEAILEALTVAALSRLPTDSEKKLTLASIASAKDRKTAWMAVAKALAGPEAKRADTLWLNLQAAPPVPPAKP